MPRPYKGEAMTRPILLAAAVLLMAVPTHAAEKPLTLTLRTRAEVKPKTDVLEVIEKPASWDAARTALIICDVWDKHWCASASRRTGELAPRIDRLAKAVRSRGGLVIHGPSDTMKTYEGTPQRRRAQDAPKANPPVPIQRWCYLNPDKEGKLPIDDSDGGCDDHPQCKNHRAWQGQHPAIALDDADALTDNGQEVYNLLAQRGVKHVIVCGVHTNMCVLGRSFGIRQLTALGFDVALARDLTDTMYNPRKAPFVPHDRGTDLVVAHVERHWCPTFHSSDILGDARPPTVAIAIAENEYKAKETLPEFAKKELEPLGIRCVLVTGDPKQNNLDKTDAIAAADVLLIYMRRQTLPDEQLKRFQAHFAAGKPVIGLRTASHAFQNYLAFDPDVLGGNYKGHHGKTEVVTVNLTEGALPEHPLLHGVTPLPFKSNGSLYKASPLSKTATPLLTGSIPNQPAEPIAWLNSHNGGKVFYTSLGHPDDFSSLQFRTVLRNAVLWTLEKPIPRPQ